MKFISTKKLEYNDGTILYIDVFSQDGFYYLYDSLEGSELEVTIEGKKYDKMDIDEYIEFVAFSSQILEIVEDEQVDDDKNICLN